MHTYPNERLHHFEIWLSTREIEEIRQHLKDSCIRDSELVDGESILDRWYYEQTKVLSRSTVCSTETQA